MKRNTRILSSLAALAGLTLLPALGGLNEAEAKNKRHKGRHDNGKHLGWSKGKHKGKHKGWSKSSQNWRRSDWNDRRGRRDDDDDDRRDYRRDSRDYRRDYRTPTRRPGVRDVWRRPTTQTRGRLVGTHYHSTQGAAAAAMRYAQSKGYRATSTYGGPGRWIVRVFTR